ncbi:SH3 domain-containing protein [Bacillus sp. CECT 9360]|uniref:SH3 domain-containing protein n=1 Tax=Bacillus sp. CECT 9360 TaxID=2845821 RepID=UPI001E350800|nr:SH3 domain-containing protein [Bacillus sp. CECT 9360]CAH0343778.1 hypothetical protein BCI9360_00002 [Bacillus sp. CECT 9360]
MRKLGKAFILSSVIITGAATLPIGQEGALIAEAASVKFSKTSYQTTTNVNLRSGAGTKYKTVITIPKGKVVTSTEKNGSWYKVSYTYKSNGKNVTKTGWVISSSLKEYYQYSTIATSYYFTKKTTNLYSTPDMKKKQLYTVGINNGFYSTQKIVNSIGQTWYRVHYNGKTVYVNGSEVTNNVFTSFTQTKYQSKKDTYLYEFYGNAHKKLVKIPKGAIVSSNKRIGDWYLVTYGGKTGYFYIGDFSKDNIITEEKITDTTYITTSTVKVKKAADEASENISELPISEIVIATHKVSNGWYKISFDGKTGYVPVSSLKQVRTGALVDTRDSYQFIDLRTQSPVTAQQINDYIAKNVTVLKKPSVLTNKGQVFIDAGKSHGVNALYLAAHAIHESGFGTSQISLGKNNLFGFGSYDLSPYISSTIFPSVETNIDFIAREIKATYLKPGYWKHKGAYLGFRTNDMSNTRQDPNSEGMNFYYATDPNWGKGIARHMEMILPYNKAYYSEAAVNTDYPELPVKPDLSDVFPVGIQAKANKDLVLDSQKGSNDAVFTLKSGTTFTLLEKTNDYWIKVKVGDTIYWSNDVKFDKYKEYISVQNLGRNLAIEPKLNVRKEPVISADNVITQLNLNDYVQFMLEKDSTITRDATKKWYKIKLADGTIGWVSAQYVVQELK